MGRAWRILNGWWMNDQGCNTYSISLFFYLLFIIFVFSSQNTRHEAWLRNLLSENLLWGLHITSTIPTLHAHVKSTWWIWFHLSEQPTAPYALFRRLEFHLLKNHEPSLVISSTSHYCTPIIRYMLTPLTFINWVDMKGVESVALLTKKPSNYVLYISNLAVRLTYNASAADVTADVTAILKNALSLATFSKTFTSNPVHIGNFPMYFK